MLEAPDVRNTQINACIEREYGLSTTDITFLPIGADVNTAVYRIAVEGGDQYFLKLRRGNFPTGTVTIPHWLATTGMEPLITPIPTRSTGTLWVELDPFTAILYPFVTGRSGWEVDLSHRQWKEFGEGLKALYMSVVPPELTHMNPREGYSSMWRDRITAFLEQAAGKTYSDPVASGLALLLNEKNTTIRHILTRAGKLAQMLVQQPPMSCLCHGDVHAGNILIDTTSSLYIVDWDTLVLAPKERDLMFVGGGVGGVWRRDYEVKWFYEGYGQAEINRTALSYYRFERIVQDIGETCEEIFATTRSGEDHAVMLEQLARQFEPANVVEIAYDTDRQLHAAN